MLGSNFVKICVLCVCMCSDTVPRVYDLLPHREPLSVLRFNRDFYLQPVFRHAAVRFLAILRWFR
jgi:hypothetical protein